MRALLLFGAFATIVVLTVAYPYVGLLAWAWFSFMHPHREAYGFAHDFQFDFYIALTTSVAWLVSRERKILPIGATPILIALFALWICVTTYCAIDSDFSYPLWERTEKSLVLVFFVMLMANTKTRLHALVWVIVISLGYHAVKGAGFVLFGSGGLVFGPEDSMIYDNNALSVALVTILPFIVYLIRNSKQLALKIGCGLLGFAIIVTVVGTFSRGGFLALVAMATLLALRSRAKIAVIVVGIVAALVLTQVVPDAWRERMNTIWAASSDTSVQGRFQAWGVAWNVATARPLLGGGFRFGEQQPVWDRYSGLSESVPYHAAHNIYFEVLGEHGFIGLAIYLLIMLSALRNTQIAARLSRNRRDGMTVLELANALQLSILCLAIAGNSLSIAYYDAYLTIFGMTFALRSLVESVAVPGRADDARMTREPEQSQPAVLI